MNLFKYLIIILICIKCIHLNAQQNDLKWTKSNLKGHWKLIDTKIVNDIPFLKIPKLEEDPMNMVNEDSPWDHYTEYDLVFEHDTMYKIHYPIQAFEPIRFNLDSAYIHFIYADSSNDRCPIQVNKDTLYLYRPVKTESGYFKETYIQTNFNDSILYIMKKYGINYPELAGTWILVREEDYDYGTYYELKFPHKIPNSIEFSSAQMIAALEQPKIFMMKTDGIKRAYTFWYHYSTIYFKPGKWYKKKNDPMIHFNKNYE